MTTLNNTQIQIDEPVDTPTFAKQISVEEYNKQKDVYTQKALKDLNDQMKSFIKPTTSKSKSKLSISLPNSDNDDDDDDNVNNNLENSKDSDSDYTENRETTNSNQSVNFIIKHYVNEQIPPQQQLLKKRKITNTQSSKPIQTVQQTNSNITDAIYAQHELDMENINKLKLKNNTLKFENEELDKKKHFLTLELSNAQCEISDYKKQVSYLKDENIRLKQFITIMQKSDEDFLLYVKFILYLLICLCILLFYVFYL